MEGPDPLECVYPWTRVQLNVSVFDWTKLQISVSKLHPSALGAGEDKKNHYVMMWYNLFQYSSQQSMVTLTDSNLREIYFEKEI